MVCLLLHRGVVEGHLAHLGSVADPSERSARPQDINTLRKTPQIGARLKVNMQRLNKLEPKGIWAVTVVLTAHTGSAFCRFDGTHRLSGTGSCPGLTERKRVKGVRIEFQLFP